MKTTSLSTLFILSIASPALADTLNVAGVGEQWTRPCDGHDVIVDGVSHNVSLTGECRTVTINGSSNQVAVEAAVKIVVNGTDNAVAWQRGVRTKKPRIALRGLNNRARRVTAATAPAPATSPGAISQADAAIAEAARVTGTTQARSAGPASPPRPSSGKATSGSACSKDKICPDCSTGNYCARTCKGGGCAFTASGAGGADFSCAGGGCTLNHTGAGAATLSCAGGNCKAVSTASGTTDVVDCKGKGCRLDCANASGVCEGP